MGGCVAQEQQRAVDFVLLARAWRRSRLQTVGAFDPVARKSEIAFGFKGCKRRKPDAALAAKIVMAAANPIGQSQKRTALVEGGDLGVGIAQELRRDHGEQRRFSSARRPENQRVADIRDMEVEAERRGARGGSKQERRRILRKQGIGVQRKARPARGERQQICEIETMDERPAHIRRGVSGQGSDPSLKGVDGLDPDRKSVAAHFACDRGGPDREQFWGSRPEAR